MVDLYDVVCFIDSSVRAHFVLSFSACCVRQLFVTFDSDTDRGGYGGTEFDCDAVLDFARASFATCTWTADGALTASLDAQASCLVGENVTSLAGVLRPSCGKHADCSCWPTANASARPIRPPSPPLIVEPRLIGASVVGSCRQVRDRLSFSRGGCIMHLSPPPPPELLTAYHASSDVLIDASTSTGGGGRDWDAIAWSANRSASGGNVTGRLRAHLDEQSTTRLEVRNRISSVQLAKANQRPPNALFEQQYCSRIRLPSGAERTAHTRRGIHV